VSEYETPEIIKEVMDDFKVDKETAERIIAFCSMMAMERMEKWVRGMRKRQKDKAEYIYQLTKKLKKGDMKVVDEIEKKILELVVES
jgi:hypothetical protein